MSLEAEVRLARGALTLDVALAVPSGSTLALLGPNGAGKSTIVQVLAGLLRPDAGRIALDGRALLDTAAGVDVPPQERGVGVVFQDLLLFPHQTAEENVAFPLRARGVAPDRAAARARELLSQLGVAHRTDARPAALSGGEAQRVALARALAAEPSLLLLDEPLSALDVQARGNIRALLGRVLTTFPGSAILVTHDPVDAMTLGDRLAILEGGRITQTGPPDAVRRAPATAYAAELVGVNLFRGRLVPLEPGAARLVTDTGEIVVATSGITYDTTDGVIARLRPADIALHLEEPHGSPRNVLYGRVAAISLDGLRARVQIDSHPPVTAEITPGSVARLGLAEGIAVWASFKAVEVELVMP
jgi:molybdate transport system ATP-binding protein